MLALAVWRRRRRELLQAVLEGRWWQAGGSLRLQDALEYPKRQNEMAHDVAITKETHRHEVFDGSIGVVETSAHGTKDLLSGEAHFNHAVDSALEMGTGEERAGISESSRRGRRRFCGWGGRLGGGGGGWSGGGGRGRGSGGGGGLNGGGGCRRRRGGGRFRLESEGQRMGDLDERGQTDLGHHEDEEVLLLESARLDGLVVGQDLAWRCV